MMSEYNAHKRKPCNLKITEFFDHDDGGETIFFGGPPYKLQKSFLWKEGNYAYLRNEMPSFFIQLWIKGGRKKESGIATINPSSAFGSHKARKFGGNPMFLAVITKDIQNDMMSAIKMDCTIFCF